MPRPLGTTPESRASTEPLLGCDVPGFLSLTAQRLWARHTVSLGPGPAASLYSLPIWVLERLWRGTGCQQPVFPVETQAGPRFGPCRSLSAARAGTPTPRWMLPPNSSGPRFPAPPVAFPVIPWETSGPVDQGSADFFLKGPDGKYFRLCRPVSESLSHILLFIYFFTTLNVKNHSELSREWVGLRQPAHSPTPGQPSLQFALSER